MKKYELSDIHLWHQEKKLSRIRALVDIDRWQVKKGDLGGWIFGYRNLSNDDDCWVSDDAKVYGLAVIDGGHIFGDADISGSVYIKWQVKRS